NVSSSPAWRLSVSHRPGLRVPRTASDNLSYVNLGEPWNALCGQGVRRETCPPGPQSRPVRPRILTLGRWPGAGAAMAGGHDRVCRSALRCRAPETAAPTCTQSVG